MACSLYNYAKEQQGWTPCTHPASGLAQLPTELRILSFNVWGAGDVYPQPRMHAILNIISNLAADVVCLQEMTDHSLGLLFGSRAMRLHYASTNLVDQRALFSDAQAPRDRTEGVVLLLRKPLLSSLQSIAFVPFVQSTHQGRCAIQAIFSNELGQPAFQLITSHFESLASSAHIRHEQYTEVIDLASHTPRAPTLLIGDFNHASYDEIQCLLQRDFVDVFPLAPQEDPLVAHATFGHLYPFFFGRTGDRRKPKRLDLALLRGKGLVPVRASLVGDQEPVYALFRTAEKGKGKGKKKKKLLRCATSHDGRVYPVRPLSNPDSSS